MGGIPGCLWLDGHVWLYAYELASETIPLTALQYQPWEQNNAVFKSYLSCMVVYMFIIHVLNALFDGLTEFISNNIHADFSVFCNDMWYQSALCFCTISFVIQEHNLS